MNKKKHRHHKLDYLGFDGYPLTMNFYSSCLCSESRSVVCWIHGGDFRNDDWRIGGEFPCPILDSLIEAGFAVAYLPYRGIDFGKFPMQLKDCQSGLKCLASKAASLRLDLLSVGIIGSGAGANLAMLLSQDPTGGGEDESKEKIVIKAVVSCMCNTTLLSVSGKLGIGFRSFGYPFRVAFEAGGIECDPFGSVDDDQAMKLQRAIFVSPEIIASRGLPPTFFAFSSSTGDPRQDPQRWMSCVREAKRRQSNVELYINNSGACSFYGKVFREASIRFLIRHINGETDIGQVSREVIVSDGGEVQLFKEDIIPEEKWNTAFRFSGFVCPLNLKHRNQLISRYQVYFESVTSLVDIDVYLPPEYKDNSSSFPVLYSVAPHHMSSEVYTIGHADMINFAINAGVMPPMMVVYIQAKFCECGDERAEEGEWNGNSFEECPQERLVALDLVKWVEKNFRARSSRMERILQGECEAAVHCIALGARYQNIFNKVIATTPVYRPGLVKLLTETYIPEDFLLLEIPSRDHLLTNAQSVRLHGEMERLGIPHIFIREECNGHGFGSVMLSRNFPDVNFHEWSNCNERGKIAEDNTHDIIKDIPYRYIDNDILSLDLILPKERKLNSEIPVLLCFNGADWRGEYWKSGFRKGLEFAELCGEDFAVACIEVRNSDKGRFPEQILDAIEALTWIIENKNIYNLDTDRIGLVGEGSGAYLAVFLGVISNQQSVTTNSGWELRVPTINCVVSCSGFFSIGDLDGMHWRDAFGSGILQSLSSSAISAFLGESYLSNPSIALEASPVNYITKGKCEFCFIHGARDAVISARQSGLVHHLLRESGCSSELRIIDNAGHGIRALQIEKEVLDYLKQNLLNDVSVTRVNEVEGADEPMTRNDGGYTFRGWVDPIRWSTGLGKYHSFYSETMNQEVSFISYDPDYEIGISCHKLPILYLFHGEHESPRDYGLFIEYLHRATLVGETQIVRLVILNIKYELLESYPKLDLRSAIQIRSLIDDLENSINAEIIENKRMFIGFGTGAKLAMKMPQLFPNSYPLMSLVARGDDADEIVKDIYYNRSNLSLNLRHQIDIACDCQLKEYSLITDEGEGLINIRRLSLNSKIKDLLVSYLESEFHPFEFLTLASE